MEPQGIENTLETIEDLQNVLIDGIQVAKAVPNPAKALIPLVKLLNDGVDLVAEASATLPELGDLDEIEASQLGAASYNLVKALIEALRG